jgi:hypothetical protein
MRVWSWVAARFGAAANTASRPRIKAIVKEFAGMLRILALVFGVIAGLLGLLWLLQGLGLVQVRPILCFADCAPVQGPSVTWAVVGVIALAIGCYGVFWSRRPSA